MTTVSVDLAYRDYRDVGVAVIKASPPGIDVSFVQVKLTGDPRPRELAKFLVSLCAEHTSKTLLLDGPQGWKDPFNGLEHSRVCERVMNTPAKTGLPGMVKPKNYSPFVAFSISVFDEVFNLGWRRYTGFEPPDVCVAAESFPLSAWRSLKLRPLPAKRKCGRSLVAECSSDVCKAYDLNVAHSPTHDELQALVAGLAGPALECRDLSRLALSGVAPFVVDGTYREGFIVNPCF
jgi:hypothetical protein